MSSQDPTAAPNDPTTAAALAEPPTVPPVATGSGLLPAPLRPFVPLLLWLAFLAVALIANSGGLGRGEFIGADRALIADNTFLRSLGGLQRIWTGILDPEGYRLSQYAPLAQATFFFDRLIWGDFVGGYRLTSCLLHATTGLMLWYLLRRLAMPGAVVVALLFVAHPMMVESVGLLAERRTILATLFGLASTFLVLRAAGAIAPVVGKDKSALPDDPLRLYAMAATLFVLGLFAHPLIALLPIVALLIVWGRRLPIDPTLVGTTVAMAIAGCAMLGFASSVERDNSGVPAEQWRRDVTPGGDLVMRAQLAGRGVAFYAAKLAIPFPIKSNYDRPRTPNDAAFRAKFLTEADRDWSPRLEPDVSAGNVVAWLPLVGVVAALAGLAVAAPRIGRAPLVAAAAFVLCLLPVLGVVDLGWMWESYVADRAAYLAAIPFLAGIVGLAARYLSGADQRSAMVSTLAVVAVAYVGIAANVSRRYADGITYWKAAADVRHGNPRSASARLGYVDAVLSRRPINIELAKQELENARRLRPSDPAVHLRIGQVREYLGFIGDALNGYIYVMTNFSDDPRGYLAAAALSRRQADAKPTDAKLRYETLRYYREAVARDPRDPWAQIWLGETAFSAAARLPDRNDPQIPELVEEAAVAFDHAVENDPYDPDKLVAIARTSIAMGKFAYAANLLRSAITFGKDRADAYELIGDAAIANGDAKGAEAAIRRATEIEPDAFSPRLKLGSMLQAQGRFDDAKAQLKRALEIQPDHAEAKRRLAEVEAGNAGQSTTQPTTFPAMRPTA